MRSLAPIALTAACLAAAGRPLAGQCSSEPAAVSAAPPSPSGGSFGPASPLGPLPLAPLTPGSLAAPPTSWEAWWNLRVDAEIELKRSVWSASPSTSSHEFYLGAGESAQGAESSRRPTPEQVRDQIAPVLLAALEESRSNALTSACALALARLDLGESARAAVSSRLLELAATHPGQEVREASLVALGVGAAEGDLRWLAGQLVERSKRTGQRAAGARWTERQRALAALALGISASRNSREDVRRYAAGVLLEGLGFASHASQEFPLACAVALGTLQLQRSRERLDLASARERVPQSSADALAARLMELAHSGAFDRSVSAHVVLALARTLASCGHPAELETAAVEFLAEVLASRAKGHTELRQAAVQALGLFTCADHAPRWERARALLEEQALQGDAVTRKLALVALAEQAARPGPSGWRPDVAARARSVLLRRMQRGGSTDRPWAALALGQLERAVGRLGQPSASESGQALRSAARDGTSPDEVAAACLALGLMGDGGGAALLRAAYERSSEFDPRGQLALALGLAKDRSHAPALLADLSQARFRPSYMAQLATGLALMQETSAVPTLLELLADARSAQSQAAAAGALASCGDLRAVTALTELLARRSNADLARAAAAAALGQIADRDPLPWRARITPGLLWSAAPSSLVAPPGSAPGLLNLP